MGFRVVGLMKVVRRKPATILPKASRLIGLVSNGLFSLIVLIGENRGWLSRARKINRVLYTAVNVVATSVRHRAQAFALDILRDSIIESLE